MKAAYVEAFGSEDAFIYGDQPDPELGPRQVLIRVKAAAINRGDLFGGPAAMAARPLPSPSCPDGRSPAS